MNQKAQTFAALAESTASQLTKSYTEWTGFLSSMGRLYKDKTDLLNASFKPLLCPGGGKCMYP